MISRVDSMVELARMFIEPVIKEDGEVCDATCGNGYDTLFMAALAKKGVVYSFDIQREALESARRLLVKKGLDKNVSLIHDGHENMAKYINGPVQAVMFNLGYLPGGNHQIITKKESTIKAIGSALELLSKGGRVSIVAYTGHQGGYEEREAIKEYVLELDPAEFAVINTKVVNRKRPAPELFLIERMGV